MHSNIFEHCITNIFEYILYLIVYIENEKKKLVHFRWFGWTYKDYYVHLLSYSKFYLLNLKIVIKIVLVSGKYFFLSFWTKKNQRLIYYFFELYLQISLYFYLIFLFNRGAPLADVHFVPTFCSHTRKRERITQNRIRD